MHGLSHLTDPCPASPPPSSDLQRSESLLRFTSWSCLISPFSWCDVSLFLLVFFFCFLLRPQGSQVTDWTVLAWDYDEEQVEVKGEGVEAGKGRRAVRRRKDVCCQWVIRKLRVNSVTNVNKSRSWWKLFYQIIGFHKTKGIYVIFFRRLCKLNLQTGITEAYT